MSSLPVEGRRVLADVHACFLASACLVLGLSGLIFGYDIGVISGALPHLTDEFSLSPMQQGTVVSLLALGSMFAGPIGGYVCDRIGRKPTIFVQNLLFASGTLCVVLARSVSMLCLGRVLMGGGSAFSAVASLSYLCELSPLEIRGIVTSAYEMLVVTGILLAWVADYVFVGASASWRWMFGTILVAIVVQTVTVLLLPESPRWLLLKGYEEEGAAVLQRLYHTPAVAEHELSLLRAELKEDMAVDAAAHGTGTAVAQPLEPMAELWAWRAPALLALMVALFMQMSGGVAVRNYAGSILVQAGFGPLAVGRMLLSLGVIKVLCTALAIAIVDIVGRRVLMLIGVGMMTAGMGVLGVSLGGGIPFLASAGPLIGCALVIAGYSYSFGPLAWLLWAEIFPTGHRGAMIGLSSFFSNAIMFLNNLFFQPLAARMGLAALCGVYCAINVIAFGAFAYLCVETMAASPEETREKLERRLLIGQPAQAGPRLSAAQSSPGFVRHSTSQLLF